MGSNRSMSRENKKKQLRSQMVSPDKESPSEKRKMPGSHWSSDRGSDFGRCGRIYIL